MNSPTVEAPSEEPAPDPHEGPQEDRQTYLYRHAGIEEREGHIPLWLVGVVAGLLIWSLYYMLRYWSEP
jgi:hypothetical protein